jgi:CheY-like chemotaxis protein
VAGPLPGQVWSGQNLFGRWADVAVVRVLLVDDQVAFVRAMIGVVEETPGFDVVGVAASGEESIQLAEALRPDLVLMDVNLPGIDGLEATRRLRECAGSSPVVILLSTYDEDAGDGFVAESGAVAYVTKSSFDPDRLEDLWSNVAR